MNNQEQDNNLIQNAIGVSLSHEESRLFRVELFYHLDSDMKVIYINGKKNDLNSTKVLINDIGPSGLKFISNLVLPVTPTIIFSFKTLVLDETLNLSGHVVWKEELLNGLYKYGVKFLHTPSEEEHLVKLFNTLQICARKSPIVSGCSFYTGDVVEYFLDDNKKTIENPDLEETKKFIMKREGEILNNYKELLEIYRNYNGIEEIESLIYNFIKRVKQVVDKFEV